METNETLIVNEEPNNSGSKQFFSKIGRWFKFNYINIIKHFFLFIGGLTMLMPFIWMILSSFKTEADLLSYDSILPKKWILKNFSDAWKASDFLLFYRNSILVTLITVALTMFVTILAAYGFSKLKFRGRDVLFTLLITMMMVPYEMLMITNYQTMVKFDLYGRIWSLIVPFTSSIFYTFILRNFFLSVPDTLYRSAKVDGSSDWRYLWEVMVPIAKPTIVTITLLDAITCWNSYLWTMLMAAGSPGIRTLPYGLTVFTSEAGVHYNLWMAGSTIVVLPMIILFLFCRKSIITGVSRGGIKG